MSSQRALIGTYTEAMPHTHGGGPGVFLIDIDDEGRMTQVGDALTLRNPSYLSAAGNTVYATSEVVDYQPDPSTTNPEPDGCVYAIETNWAQAKLSLKQTISSGGPGPAWCRYEPQAGVVLVAGYLSGKVLAYPVTENGRLATPSEHQRVGTGPVTARQEAPHAHAAMLSPDGRWVYAADLGTDTIAGYELDKRLRLQLVPEAGVQTPPGTGPRHTAFTPDGQHLVTVLELSGELATHRYERENGALIPIDQKPSATDTAAHAQPSELVVHPNGQTVYVANRLVDVITRHTLTLEGRITPQADFPCAQTPRHIALTPDERWLLCACQDADVIQSFRVDTTTGDLTPSSHELTVASPCFIRFPNSG